MTGLVQHLGGVRQPSVLRGYPAVLLTGAVTDKQTGEAHVTKMCAALQHATSSDRPILLRREPDSGHAARSASKDDALVADILAFAAKHTGLAARRGPDR